MAVLIGFDESELSSSVEETLTGAIVKTYYYSTMIGEARMMLHPLYDETAVVHIAIRHEEYAAPVVRELLSQGLNTEFVTARRVIELVGTIPSEIVAAFHLNECAAQGTYCLVE